MDEAFVPYTRSDLKLPSKPESSLEIYKHALEDSPLMSLWRLFIMNFFGHRKQCALLLLAVRADALHFRHLPYVRRWPPLLHTFWADRAYLAGILWGRNAFLQAVM